MLFRSHNRMGTSVAYRLETTRQMLKHLERSLVLHHPQGILDKGYAYVKDSRGHIVESSSEMLDKNQYELTFKDGKVPVVVKRSLK